MHEQLSSSIKKKTATSGAILWLARRPIHAPDRSADAQPWHQKAILGTPFPFPRVFSPPHPTGPRRPPQRRDPRTRCDWTGLEWSALQWRRPRGSCGPGLRSARARARRSPMVPPSTGTPRRRSNPVRTRPEPGLSAAGIREGGQIRGGIGARISPRVGPSVGLGWGRGAIAAAERHWVPGPRRGEGRSVFLSAQLKLRFFCPNLLQTHI